MDDFQRDAALLEQSNASDASKPTNSLVAEALEAHGGVRRWNEARGLASTIVSGGELWRIKGLDMDATPRRAVTEFHEQRTSIKPFGDPDWTMRWTPDHVSVENSAGEILSQRDDPRKAFAGHVYDSPWDPMHLAYFNGYAMWTYHAVPFVLSDPGYAASDIAPLQDDGKTLRGVSVRLPDAIHSHSKVQNFYFDDRGLLRRHDYWVDVWAGTAAAHYVSDYIDVDGAMLPTRRVVFPRSPDGSIDRRHKLVTVELSNFAFH